MLNPNGAAIYSAGLTEFADLVHEIVVLKAPYGKNVSKLWDKVYKALLILEALEDVDYLEEASANALYSCLSEILEIGNTSNYPVPVLPEAIVYNQGPAGDDGESVTGPQGPAGLATDFLESGFTVATPVDFFTISDSPAARWDYVAINQDGEQRAGTIIGHWSTDGSAIEMFDTSTLYIVGPTNIVFSVSFSGGTISLIATPSSDTWTVRGSRYFIPNNGNGSGPISAALPHQNIYIGNSSGVATANLVTGHVTISDTGVVSIASGVITNTHVHTSAGIEFDKMEALTPSRALVTDASGFVVTSSIPSTSIANGTGLAGRIAIWNGGAALTSDSTLLYNTTIDELTVSGTVIQNSVITGLAGLSFYGVGGAITSLIRHDFTPTSSLPSIRLGTISTDPSSLGNSDMWYNSTSHGIKARLNGSTESIVTLADTTKVLKVKLIEIGDWNMDTTANVSINHGLTLAQIRSVTGVIIRDDSSFYFPIGSVNGGAGLISAGFGSISATQVAIFRTTGGDFDTANYDSTGFNRGWITITYEG